MDLKEHYHKMYLEGIQKIKTNAYQCDSYLNSEFDGRKGLTLIIRPTEAINSNIQNFLSKLKISAPQQYFYPKSDIHITLLSIISCYEGFSLNNIDIDQYVQKINQAIHSQSRFSINLRGITVSPSCIMIQGFVNNSSLISIRDRLRNEFRNSELEQSLDKRYILKTAHATVVRFRKPFINKPALLETIATYSNFDFGTFEVNKFQLVHNNWYMQSNQVKKLHDFHF